MNWFVVPLLRPKPKRGKYPDWKSIIAANCRHQCVYCTISEGEYGGIDNFHVEHFRPKSVFKRLENDIDNLFVACAVCNRFKSDEWPGEPHKKGATPTFLNPAEADYHEHIALGGTGYFLKGKTVAGTYMVEQMYLNRSQLLISRRYRTVLAKLSATTSFFTAELEKLETTGRDGQALIQEMGKVLLSITQLQVRIAQARPYTAGATQRSVGLARKKR